MIKIKSFLFGTVIGMASLSSLYAGDVVRHDSGLVGPGYYGPEESAKKQEHAVIKEKFGNYLKSDITMEELDQLFTTPCTSTGWTRDVLESFSNSKPTPKQKENALQSLPEDKVLAIHLFENQETEEGYPLQQTVNTTYANNVLSMYEQVVKVEGTKCGFNFVFKTKIDLTGKEEPKTSFKETPVEEKIEAQISKQAKKLNEANQNKSVLNVAIYSSKDDILKEGGVSSAIRQTYLIEG